MKRLIAALAAGFALTAGAGNLIASASSAPEVDATSAKIQLSPFRFASVTCAGEDGVNYVTFTGLWKGAETDTGGPTDYTPMTGPLVVRGIVWTINLTTQRGVLHGTATLVSSAGTGVVYSGPITLVTQGLPNSAGSAVQARGWVDAATYTAGVRDGGSLLANVELEIMPTLAATGEFGSPTMGFPDLSAVTNNLHC